MSNIIVNQLTHPQKVRILYKTVLRLHRGLPDELRELGDKYVRDEFRRHLKCAPMEAQMFMTEWAVGNNEDSIKHTLQQFCFQKYAVTISKQLGLRGKPQGTIGDELDVQTVQMLKDDQVVQLYELMLAAKGIEGDIITANDVKNK